MPVFRYRGLDNAGKHVSGIMDASDEYNLEDKLRPLGFWLIHAENLQPDKFEWWRMSLWSNVSRRDLIDFWTLMNFQIKAGVPLIQAIEVAAQECDNAHFRFILGGVHRNIEAGSMFYEALEKSPEAFTPHVVNLVRAGELSGKLTETFSELRRHQEWLEHVIADIRQASIYPTVIITVVSAFVLVLFTFVIPKFNELLKGVNANLPPLTRVVFGASDFAKATWWMWLLGAIFIVTSVQMGRRYSKAFAYKFDQLRLRLPAFGELNRIISVSRFTHNLAIMYRSGIPILQSLHLSQGLVGNAVVEYAISDIERNVAAGEALSEAVSRHKVFPPMVMRMVVLGESTGNLDEALENVSTYYNEIIPRRIKKIFSLMEPLLMIFLIGLVGTVALSIFLPILDMMSHVGRQ